ncbi:hypothetical protein DFH27DRAFT_643484 [Peziza echinospora]|nr:hypothetical protein DFH27DRAFT_643484 [Peziza echinospora]
MLPKLPHQKLPKLKAPHQKAQRDVTKVTSLETTPVAPATPQDVTEVTAPETTEVESTLPEATPYAPAAPQDLTKVIAPETTLVAPAAQQDVTEVESTSPEATPLTPAAQRDLTEMTQLLPPLSKMLPNGFPIDLKQVPRYLYPDEDELAEEFQFSSGPLFNPSPVTFFSNPEPGPVASFSNPEPAHPSAPAPTFTPGSLFTPLSPITGNPPQPTPPSDVDVARIPPSAHTIPPCAPTIPVDPGLSAFNSHNNPAIPTEQWLLLLRDRCCFCLLRVPHGTAATPGPQCRTAQQRPRLYSAARHRSDPGDARHRNEAGQYACDDGGLPSTAPVTVRLRRRSQYACHAGRLPSTAPVTARLRGRGVTLNVAGHSTLARAGRLPSPGPVTARLRRRSQDACDAGHSTLATPVTARLRGRGVTLTRAGHSTLARTGVTLDVAGHSTLARTVGYPQPRRSQHACEDEGVTLNCAGHRPSDRISTAEEGTVVSVPRGTIGVDQRGVAAVEDGESVGVDLVKRVHRSRFWGTAGKDN